MEDIEADAGSTGRGLDITHDEEATRAVPEANSAAVVTADAASRDSGQNAHEGGLGTGRVEIIDDEEAPVPVIQQYGIGCDQHEKVNIKGRFEQQISDSGPIPDEEAAMAHDDSAVKAYTKSRLQSVTTTAPLPDRFSALACDDSMGLAKSKANVRNIKDSFDSTTEPRAEDEGDAQPHIRDGSILPRFFAANTGTRNRYDSRSHAPDPRAQSIQPAAETTAAVTPRSTTADVQIVSPYINGNDEICIPEAIAVDDKDMPVATIIRPDKYSLTIAGRKIRLCYLILGVLAMLGTGIALAISLTKTPEPADHTADVPSCAPSVSLAPTSIPSGQPSGSPTSILHAELVENISEYSGGRITSFSGPMHRKALDWLVIDQSMWREEPEKAPLSGVEIMERFVLALLHFETTQGRDWSNSFQFMNKSMHVCQWKDALYQSVRKGVTGCTRGSIRRVSKLTLPTNYLKGFIPTEIGLLRELNDLNIEGNKVTGSLPTELGLLHELNSLRIGNNVIEGKIPDTLGSLINITHLELNNNNLVGPINSLAGLPNLQYVDLTYNELTGSLMDASNLTKLHSFKAGDNKFSGTVPTSFSTLSSFHSGAFLSGVSIDFL